jgi:hypothetical protein
MHRPVPTEMHRAKSATALAAPRIAPGAVRHPMPLSTHPTSQRHSGAGSRAGMVAVVITSDTRNVTAQLNVPCTPSARVRTAGATARA